MTIGIHDIAEHRMLKKARSVKGAPFEGTKDEEALARKNSPEPRQRSSKNRSRSCYKNTHDREIERDSSDDRKKNLENIWGGIF